MKEMNGDKAPGSGFTPAFFQHYWQVLAGDIMTPFLKEFHDSCQFEKSLHASFITFIPKKNFNALNILDFRSISLVGGIHKIGSKSVGQQADSVGEVSI